MSLQLIPGQSLDWGESLESGPDSEEFLRPPVDPTPAEKKVSFFFQGPSEPQIQVNVSLSLIRCVSSLKLRPFEQVYFHQSLVACLTFVFRPFQKLSSQSGNLGTTSWDPEMPRKHQIQRRKRQVDRQGTRNRPSRRQMTTPTPSLQQHHQVQYTFLNTFF